MKTGRKGAYIFSIIDALKEMGAATTEMIVEHIGIQRGAVLNGLYTLQHRNQAEVVGHVPKRRAKVWGLRKARRAS